MTPIPITTTMSSLLLIPRKVWRRYNSRPTLPRSLQNFRYFKGKELKNKINNPSLSEEMNGFGQMNK
jgi:hypothetical protein